MMKSLISVSNVHVVYYEIWDSETPLTFVVRDVVIREPREV